MKQTPNNRLITAVVANDEGEIFELKGYAAGGMAGTHLVPLSIDATVNMPYGSELLLLPDRKPVLYNLSKKSFEILSDNPYSPGSKIFPVAVFNSPGYIASFISSYKENNGAKNLPLFSYSAVGWNNGKFRSAAICITREKRQDLRFMKIEKVVDGIADMKKKMPENRLRRHLEKCALEYGCPAAKNFFLGRYEAPLPTSRSCNAQCMGCLSYQKDSNIPNAQERITFTPSPDEIAQIALEHIKKVKSSVVSFGQGCEGDPLLSAHVIEPAIRLIRSQTKKGTININTNASRPDVLADLLDAGADSIRISLNSIREKFYAAYFRPLEYSFKDVLKSIEITLSKKKFIAVNYLNSPGFTDSPEEFNAMLLFLKKYPINLIQWRNLNFDPVKYFEVMNKIGKHGIPLGMSKVLYRLKKTFPQLHHGYFNPPKEKFYARVR